MCSDEERSACIAGNMLLTRVGSVWKSFRYHIESLGTISDPIIKDFVKELLFVCSHTPHISNIGCNDEQIVA